MKSSTPRVVADGTTSAAEPLFDLPEAKPSLAWAMVESSPDALVVVDERGVIELVNRQTEVMFGYDRGDLLGRNVETLMPDRLGRAHTAHRTRYRAEPTVRSMGTGMELLARRSDGTEFPVEISLSPLVDDDSLLIMAAVRDVSERVEAEARNHEVRRLLDAIEDGVFMFDPHTLGFTYVNDGAARQVGYSRDELARMTPLHLKPEFTESTFRELLAPLVAGAVESLHVSTLHRRKDGTDTPVEIVLQIPVEEGSAVSPSCVALVRDITNRLDQEAKLREVRQREVLLADRERIGRDMHDTVIARLFGAGMALTGTVSQVDDADLSRRLDGVIDQIDDAIKEIRSTVYGLRSRLDWGRGVRGQILSLAAAQRDVLGFEPNTNLAGPIDDLSASIVDDLLAALRESLTNVAKYAKADKVTIDVFVDDDVANLVVTDDGIGFADSATDDSGTASRLSGNGLRNLTVRAASLGGSLAVSSRPGVGTVVHWSVPLVQDPESARSADSD